MFLYVHAIYCVHDCAFQILPKIKKCVGGPHGAEILGEWSWVNSLAWYQLQVHFEKLVYTGGVPQQSDVKSAVAVKMSTALWHQKQGQHCRSSGSDCAEITMCTLM